MLGRRIAYNTIVSVVGRVIATALALIIIGFLARYLGQTGFGQYTTVLAFLYIFTVLADLGLYSICLRDISRPGADESKIASNVFTLRFFVGLFVFAAAPLVALFFPYSFETKLGILVGAAGFWLLSNNQVLMGVFQKYLQIDKVALAELLGRVFQLGLVAFFIWQKMGFLFIVSALVGGALVNFILVFYFVQKYIPIKWRFDFSFWRQLLKQSLPLGVAAILVMIYFKLDTVMLSVMKSQAEVGIYGLAYKILESLIFFPAMFVGLVMPIMSKYAFSQREKFKKITQQTLDVLLIVVIPLIVGTFFLSPKIVALIGGQEFILSAGVLNILIIATGIIFLGTLFSNMIISLEKQKTLAYIYGLGALINVTTNLIFIPKYSYYGAAGTTVLTELVVTGLMLMVLYQAIKELPSFHLVFKYILAALVMALFLYFFSDWNLLLLIILAVLVYFGVLYLIKGFSAKDILALIKKEA
jgi:O-antigen/teichoic acid export membrane protein